ncbi:MAG: serine--tRNA ligase [Marinilabiliaceae bacterium]|nr:serine--tRNA ligase [Marinilabiliaceae bacterium]
MLTLKYIQDNKSEVIERLSVKNFNAQTIVNHIIVLDDKRKILQAQADAKQAEAKLIAKEVGALMQAGKNEEAEVVKSKTASLKDDVKELNAQQVKVEEELQLNLVLLPNLPHVSVPKGKGAEDNVTVKTGGEIPKLENALPHWELAKKYDIIDFELGVKLTGAGFPVYKGKGARLQRALISFFLDQAVNAGYVEVQPPLMVNEDSGFGTGQLPDKEGQMYHATADNLYLIPTAEVPVTNIYRDVILKDTDFPVKNCAYSACFRREAGSYGKDVRGLNRLHQFDKVEIVQIAHPDSSYEILDQMVSHVQGLVEKLELPWRILRLCGGDMSFASALTFDFEVFSAAQERWLEVSSVSNFETFQANRLKCRFKDNESKGTRLVHTLNGSALALPRILAAILENNQTNDGIKMPKVLIPYCGFDIIN